MSSSKVQGKNAILTIYNVDDYYPAYCAQTVEITIETEQLLSTNVSGGGFEGNKPGKTRWWVDLSGVHFIRDTSDRNWTIADFSTEQARKNGVDIKLVFTNENGNYEQFTGHANPQTTNINGVAGQLSKFSLKLIGDGVYERNAIIPPSTAADDVKRYEYTAAGGETFFSHANLIGRTILDFERETISAVHVITSGTPDGKQVKYTSASGRFDLGAEANPGEQFVVVYK